MNVESNNLIRDLRQQLAQVSAAWTVSDFEALLRFYVEILPKVFDAERASIFIVEPDSERIWSIYGTGLEEKQIEAPRDNSVVGRAIATGECIIENNLDWTRDYHSQIARSTGFVTRNMVCAPIKSLAGRGAIGAVQILNKTDEGAFSYDDADLVERVAEFLAMGLENIQINREILRISGDLSIEINRLASELDGTQGFVARGGAMRNLLDRIRMVSSTPVSVYIHGENGTGKELVARMIHETGIRREKPFVAVNCASIPETLIESEFFGYEKGAFTGATQSRAGLFEEADGGTLFLDEIADMPIGVQAKFLRALQEGECMRLGSNKPVRFDVRVISATNQSLQQCVEQGRFREDLFYRLYSVEINVPPLRDRREDIVPLALQFLQEISQHFGRHILGFRPDVLKCFERFGWPGNVRQLRREVERLVALTPDGTHISLSECSIEITAGVPAPQLAIAGGCLPDQVRDLEIQLINKALNDCRGNKTAAAQQLGITRQGLHKKLRRYGLQPSPGVQ